ncbi:MAG: IS1595 family transposase, partial [Caulobacteraceae bacterium]
HMLHRIRLAMELGGIEKMDGEVEGDETFIGGLARNMHERRRKATVVAHGSHADHKAVVAGLLRRTHGEAPSRVRLRHVKDTTAHQLQGFVREHVEAGARLLTDSWSGYRGLGGDYTHEIVNHAHEYVRGSVHTNGIENFWSLLKRTIKGTYVSVEPFHLGRYLGEQAFRFNERKDRDYGRFAKVLSSVVGKRLTYQELTGHGVTEAVI